MELLLVTRLTSRARPAYCPLVLMYHVLRSLAEYCNSTTECKVVITGMDNSGKTFVFETMKRINTELSTGTAAPVEPGGIGRRTVSGKLPQSEAYSRGQPTANLLLQAHTTGSTRQCGAGTGATK